MHIIELETPWVVLEGSVCDVMDCRLPMNIGAFTSVVVLERFFEGLVLVLVSPTFVLNLVSVSD